MARMPRLSQILHPEVGPIPAPTDWQTDTPVAILKNVLRLTAPNPGFMTGPGTNSYLVGDAHSGFIAIDPGPADTDHLQRLWQAARFADGSGGNIRMIVCTHSHPDHSPGAKPLQALCAQGGLGEGGTNVAAAPAILGLPSAPTARAASEFTPDLALLDGEVLLLTPPDASDASHSLRVVFTPGHAANHVCLLLEEDGLLFSGDHILNGSTTVIDPPDGHMGHYLQSLDLLAAACTELQVEFILPAHGHVIPNALAAIAHLKAHRLTREAKIAAVMQSNPNGDLDQWLPLAYDDVDPRIWPVAKRSLLAHVEHIQQMQTPSLESSAA
jgi:glyoxylase-like metal-dependent hydrolase (beta-lactamase superfamily II)